ncbi:ATP-binding protein [Nostoc mirabile]|uniref:ATP-binding protein n=1 Tax=Nostoc mirabile TaxID=2907820 RepID=UPI0027E02FE5|nr:ATP-binding protein [Nostoc mirabile]
MLSDYLEEGAGSKGEEFSPQQEQHPAPGASFQCPIPTICIRTQLQEPNQVTISIADNGLGIPEDVKKQLFDPFFTTKPIGKGRGMGLEFVIKIPLIQDT